MPTLRSLTQAAWALAILLGTGSAAVADKAARTSPQAPHFGLIVSDLSNPFFIQVVRSIEATVRAGKFRAARITVVSSGFDPARQAEQFDEMIRQRMALVFVTPIESDRIAERMAKARAAGVKVVAIDALAQHVDATVMTDNRTAGAMACEHLARALGGKGEVAIINGPPNSAILTRVEGCREVLAGQPLLHLVAVARDGGASRDGGLEQMTRLLGAHPRLAGVFAINDPTALGAEAAAQATGHDDVVITTVDGSPDVVQRLQDPTSLIAASASQSPTQMGRRAAELGLDLLAGHAPDVPLTLLPPTLLTRDTIGNYRGW